ncbi:hypothetical protein E2C01_086824 [Portunus trituberculatus]|uniref:Uncharacterized protein n=1 Tax=Portunus trituberculatus TaxID=210409 RepID=A0A5B7JCG5_PORTR|nr:hypothetical protein [Portunus trituberculatus]
MSFIRFPTAERRLIQTTGLRKKVTVNAGFSRAAAATSAELFFTEEEKEEEEEEEEDDERNLIPRHPVFIPFLFYGR